MEKTVEQLEKAVSILHGEVTGLKELLASGFKKVESNFESIQVNIGLVKLARLTDEINKLGETTDTKDIEIRIFRRGSTQMELVLNKLSVSGEGIVSQTPHNGS